MDISSRILRLLQSVAADQVDQLNDMFEKSVSYLDDVLGEWEREHGLDDSSSINGKQSGQSHTHFQRESRRQSHQSRQTPDAASNHGYSKQAVEDLHLFGLTPPVTLHDIKKARNQEIKKFHPDKFLDEPEKMETAKRIMQIYNAAYDRLEREIK